LNTSGSITIANSTFRDNPVVGTGGGVQNSGGAMTIRGSSFAGNSAAVGGGVYNASGATTTIVNGTVSSNQAHTGSGGGIYNDSGGTLAMTNTTVANNASLFTGGGIYNDGSNAVLTMTNSVVAYHGNEGDCGGDFTKATSYGYNLGHDTTCTFLVTTGDISGTDPLLDWLQDNGGPTETHAPEPGSAVLDHIPNSVNGCGTTVTDDQRGVARPQGSGCDIGAVEARTFTLTVTRTGSGSGVVTGTGINCGSDCSHSYLEQSVVSLIASADVDSTFTRWSGACTNASGNCVLTMDAAKNITATFELILDKTHLPLITRSSGW